MQMRWTPGTLKNVACKQGDFYGGKSKSKNFNKYVFFSLSSICIVLAAKGADLSLFLLPGLTYINKKSTCLAATSVTARVIWI